MEKTLIDEAINAALQGDWQQAATINLQILSAKPQHIPTLNRLAKAYLELGKTKDAKIIYHQVLDLDKFNPIAKKNLKLLNHYDGKTPTQPTAMNLDFIEEPGKTYTVPLTRLGDPKLICRLLPGQIVQLTPKNRTIFVLTNDDEQIGAFTDDIAFSFKKYLEAGKEYRTTIKTASPQRVTVFLRQVD